MQTNQAAKNNKAIIDLNIDVNFPWRVTEVHPLSNYALAVGFVDGTHGIVEMKNLVMSKKAGVFSVLKDKDIFDSVIVYFDAVTWVNKNKKEKIGHGEFYQVYADLSPETMYHEIKKNGRYIVETD